LGQPVRYNGKALSFESDLIERWKALRMIVPLCPEIAAGFPTPRPPAEIERGFDGTDVIDGRGRIIEDTGTDVTENFLRGAQIALYVAMKEKCKYALLTDGSPSCGSTFIYSGNHDEQKRDGVGVVCAVLRGKGIKVFTPHEIGQLAADLEIEART
jgi:uncharacterized protein YbbK (DUF523 family)